jgi:hypothetical protein
MTGIGGIGIGVIVILTISKRGPDTGLMEVDA